MIGLATLAIVALYIGFWWWVVRVIPSRWAKGTAILVALAIPFWDIPIGYYEFRRLCSSEGGLHVYQKVQPQQKIYFDSTPSYSVNELLAQGLKVVEVTRTDGKGIARHQIGADGHLVSKDVSEPESSIRVSIIRDQELAWNILREDRLARSRAADQLLARYSAFKWRGGWLQYSQSPLLGPGLFCSFRPQDPLVAWLINGT